MQRSSHSNADATASEHQTNSKPGSPRRVNFDLNLSDGPSWHRNATSPLLSPRKGPPSIPYCDLATPLPSNRGHGLDEASRSNSPSHSRRRWAELRSIARHSLATWESSRKGTSSVTPPPASPQKSQSPGPKSPLKPCLKSPTSPTFAPQLPPPDPVPPPPRTPRRSAWRSQVAPSLPTLVEVSSAASGAKSDNASRVNKNSKANPSSKGNRPSTATGKGLRHEKYEMERKKRMRESSSKVSQSSQSTRNPHQGRLLRSSRREEQGKRVSGHEENDSELSNTSKSSRNSGNSRVVKAKGSTKKNPPRPPLTRRDALLEAMRVYDPPAPPLASSSVYSSSECSSPTVHSSSSVYSTSTATPTSPATSTEHSSPLSTRTSRRTESTSPTSYTTFGSDDESITKTPQTPQTPTSPTKTATTETTVTEIESEAETARTETITEAASSTHRTVSSVALGSALGLKRPSSAVRSVLGLEGSQIGVAQEPLVPETEGRRIRKSTENGTEERERKPGREQENQECNAAVDLPKPKPQPRVRKRKQARFPEAQEETRMPAKDRMSDPGELHDKPSRLSRSVDEQRPKRERNNGSTKKRQPSSMGKENKTPDSDSGEMVGGVEEVPRRHVSHSIKSRRSVCVRGQGINLFIDMAHAKPSSSLSPTSTTSPTHNSQKQRRHHNHSRVIKDTTGLHQNLSHLQEPPSTTVPADDDMGSCVSTTTTAVSLHPGVDIHSPNPKNLAFQTPFAPPPPPQTMQYTRPVRRPYRWPRLDRGFDGRPPLDLGKELPPLPASASEDEDEDDAFVSSGVRTRREREKDRAKHQRPHPRRLSLSLSALPDTPFIEALDVSRLAVGEKRVFRVPGSPPKHTYWLPSPGAAETASALSSTFDMGLRMRRHDSTPQPAVKGGGGGGRRNRGRESRRERGRHSYDDASAYASTSTTTTYTPPPREPPRPRRQPEVTKHHVQRSGERKKQKEKERTGLHETEVDKEIDGIARRLAFAIKNGRAKGSRAVKVSWVVGY